MNTIDSIESSRSAFLTLLEAEDFLPSESAVAEWNRTAQTDLPLSREVRTELPEPSPEEFVTFVAGYWNLQPPTRRSRWKELSEHYPTGIIASRLKHLERGLDLPDATPHSDARVNELAVLFRELFLLPPRTRAVVRHEWFTGSWDRLKWAGALAGLRSVDPAAVALDPVLAERIEKHPSLKGKVVVPPPKADKPIAWGGDFEERFSEEGKAKTRALREERRARKEAAGEKDWATTVKIGVAGMVVFAIACAILIITDDRPRPQQPLQVINTDKLPYAPPPQFKPNFTPEEIMAFAEYDPKSGQPPPPRYTMFRLTGGDQQLKKLKRDPEFMRALQQLKDTKEKMARTQAELDQLQPRSTVPTGRSVK